MRSLLVLWDIDYTLIDSGGVGEHLYGLAFKEMFGRDLPGIATLAGRTDRAIIADTLALAGVKDPETGVTFPDLNSAPFGGEAFQTNLIFPEPCEFIAQNLPACAVIRPSLTQNAGAVATATAIAASHIFDGQPQAFFTAVLELAMAADAARRGDE